MVKVNLMNLKYLRYIKIYFLQIQILDIQFKIDFINDNFKQSKYLKIIMNL